MRSLELKTLQIKDDIPLYVTLDSLSTWDKNENRYKFVTRNADSCVSVSYTHLTLPTKA